MIKRLLALFSKKQSSQKTFEEKLEQLSDYDRTARVDRHGQTHFAKDERAVRMHRALHPGHQPRPNRRPPVTQSRHQFEAPARRGMTRNATVESQMRNDDAFLQGMMVQSMINNTTSHRSVDADTCHTPHHTPTGGYDPSPSDGGGSYDGGGGGSCD